MKRYLILGIVVLVAWLGFSYHRAEQLFLAQQVVFDAYDGNLLRVKDGVEQGARLDVFVPIYDEKRQYNGVLFNALHGAASSGNEDIILYLLEKGLSINVRTDEGTTPLFIAARDGRDEAATLLVYRKAKLNIQNNLGATALTMVVTQPYQTPEKRLHLLEYMLKRGADTNLPDRYGHTPLYYAVAVKNLDAVKLLVQYGAATDANRLQPIWELLHTRTDESSQQIATYLQQISSAR